MMDDAGGFEDQQEGSVLGEQDTYGPVLEEQGDFPMIDDAGGFEDQQDGTVYNSSVPVLEEGGDFPMMDDAGGFEDQQERIVSNRRRSRTSRPLRRSLRLATKGTGTQYTSHYTGEGRRYSRRLAAKKEKSTGFNSKL